MNEYRIMYNGLCWKVQSKCWWWPFWWTETHGYGDATTFNNFDEAKNYVERHVQYQADRLREWKKVWP